MMSGNKTVLPVTGVVLIFLVLAGLVVYIRTSLRFEVAYLGIRGNDRVSPDAIVEHLNIQPHTNIFQIQLDEIQRRLESLPWVKTARVYRNFPNKISLELTERTPFALIKLDELRIVDREGVVLGSLASGSAITLPIITGKFIEQMKPEGANPQLQQAFHAIDELMQACPPVFQNIRKIQIQSLENTIFISYDENAPEIRVSLADYNENAQRLQRMYPTLQGEQLAYIDVRFARRVVVKSNKS